MAKAKCNSRVAMQAAATVNFNEKSLSGKDKKITEARRKYLREISSNALKAASAL